MNSAANTESGEVEITDRHSVRITVLGKGTFEEFTARLEETLISSTSAEIVREAKTWEDVVTKVQKKAGLRLRSGLARNLRNPVGTAPAGEGGRKLSRQRFVGAHCSLAS